MDVYYWKLKSFFFVVYVLQKVIYSEEIEVFELIDVPRCFLSTLECVEIKGFVKWEEEEMKIASYFLENSTVLKKLIVSLPDYPRPVPDSEIYKELNKLPKCSRTCQIIIDFWCSYEWAQENIFVLLLLISGWILWPHSMVY